ncbi:MAG: mycofactocin biosynthesis glycosyltransferase MftF [Solirubrobacteraceae bacterium]
MPRPPVPPGWRLRPSADLRTASDGRLLLGGTPLRLLTLSTRGTRLVAGWSAGRPVGDGRDERLLARRLLDAGLFHPAPPLAHDGRAELTIVIPVHGGSEQLRACLAALSGRWPVIVVDDGSPNPDAIAAEVQRADARLSRHPTNRGVSAARNTGLALATTPVVAFLDSDCVPSPGFPGELLAHLEDPAVGMVAPRIVSPVTQRGRIAAYERRRSALDMGAQPSLARPYGRVWYVPSAAMLARRDALGPGFDEGLEIGEDVDLVWRLHDAGWQTRYEPRVTVAHAHRIEPVAWYRRRVFYNSSVVPLRLRHPTRLPVLYLTPPAAIAWSAALVARPEAIGVLAALRAARRRQALASRLPGASRLATRMSIGETVHEGRELARVLAGPWSPLALAALVMPGRRRTARRLAALFAAWLVSDWLTDRPMLDPLTYSLLRLADESARGVGIWQGCIRARDFRSLLAARPPRGERR